MLVEISYVASNKQSSLPSRCKAAFTQTDGHAHDKCGLKLILFQAIHRTLPFLKSALLAYYFLLMSPVKDKILGAAAK